MKQSARRTLLRDLAYFDAPPNIQKAAQRMKDDYGAIALENNQYRLVNKKLHKEIDRLNKEIAALKA